MTAAVIAYRVPRLSAALADRLTEALWPAVRLGEAIETLASRAGLKTADPVVTAMPDEGQETAAAWIAWAAGRYGIEAEPVDSTLADLPAMLGSLAPAILSHGDGYLLLIGSRRGQARLLGPDLEVHHIGIEPLARALGWRRIGPVLPEIQRLLDRAGIAPRRRATVRTALLRERLAAERSDPAWVLRLPATADFGTQLRRARLPQRLGLMLGCFALTYVLEILGWSNIGAAALDGRLDFGWMQAWLLLVVSVILIRVIGGWAESLLALDFSRLLKSRLLAGALRVDLDAARSSGVGHLLATVMESQALESTATNGGLAILVSLLELGFAGWVLWHGIAGGMHVAALLIWSGVAAFLCFRYYRRLRDWSRARLEMTHHLVEQMVGHRTRLAQELPDRRDRHEDQILEKYGHVSRLLDRTASRAMAAMPAGWVFVGIAAMIPAFVAGGARSAASMAISIGGLMLAQRALSGIAGGLAGLGRAAIAWEQVAILFRAGNRPPACDIFVPPIRTTAREGKLIDASRISYRYAPGAAPVLDNLNLTIRHGDRILLEGMSGGGKSTLAALLTGIRMPDAGLLMLNGLDRPTLGDHWGQMVTSAPQFHENHVFTGSLAFNLLMGRTWPATDADLAEAEQVCIELGLGELLDRMPARLLQQVGETGWQLSHGERSRIFLARALLQKADLTILDESFAALDPETLNLCLDCADRRANALMVIAHP